MILLNSLDICILLTFFIEIIAHLDEAAGKTPVVEKDEEDREQLQLQASNKESTFDCTIEGFVYVYTHNCSGCLMHNYEHHRKEAYHQLPKHGRD